MGTAWAIAGVVIPALIGLGVAMLGLNPPGFLVARVCFSLSALALGATSLFWQFRTEQPAWWRITAGVVIWLTIGLLLPESMRWMNRREASLTVAPASSQSAPTLAKLPRTETLPTVAPPLNQAAQNKDNSLLPIVMRVNIRNDGKVALTNTGQVAVSDIQVDFSSHLMDVDFTQLKLPIGSAIKEPLVKSSSYMSGSVSISKAVLEPGEHLSYDLTKLVPFSDFPPAKLDDAAAWEGLNGTIYVFRFSFRDTRTGERYACFKVNGSYLHYPFFVNDNVASAGSSIAEQLYRAMAKNAISDSRDHYTDGAIEMQCER